MASETPPDTPAKRLTQRERLDMLWSQLKNERSPFDAHWRLIADHLFPTRPRWTVSDKNRGDRRNGNIINASATLALQTLRSGLHAGLTSPARPWMKLATPDPSLTKRRNVAVWLAEVTERMHSVFHLSNIYNALPMLYGDVATFGTGATAILEDPGSPGKPGDLFRAQVYPVGSFALGLDNRGLPTTFMRETSKSVEQIVEEYGGKDGQALERGKEIDWSNISRTVKHLYDKNMILAQVPVRWAVYPNRDYNPRSLRNAMAWKSCHWEVSADAELLLRESGFNEFPVMCPRWIAVPDEPYANDCPGMTALGDTKQLQMMERRKGQAIEKMVNPALVGPLSLSTQKVSLLPGAVTYVDVRDGMQGLKSVHDVNLRVDHLTADAQAVENRINRAFYVDLFLMLTLSNTRGSQPPTAREVDELHEEKMLVLGPVLESMIDELLDPLIDRVFAMMFRAGLIPEPPEELKGVSLTVEYTSILAQAMKMQQVGVLDRMLASTMPMVQIFPEANAAFNPRFVMREYQDSLGLHPEVIRTDEEIDAAMAAQQKQAQAAQDAANAAVAAKAGKDLGTTPFGQSGGTVLDELAGAAQGGSAAPSVM